MRKGCQIRLVIAMLAGAVIVLLCGYWLWGGSVAVVEKREHTARKESSIADKDDCADAFELRKRIVDLERQLNAALRTQVRDLERKVADAEHEGATLKSTVESATDEAEAAQWSIAAMRGRSLFAKLTSLDRVCKDRGHPGVWPTSAQAFGSSTEYFRSLLKMLKDNRSDLPPDIRDADWEDLVFDSDGKARWSVATGVTDELEDIVPVLVSANVDPTSLILKPGRHDVKGRFEGLRFEGERLSYIHKGGAAMVVKRKYATHENVYRNQSFTIPVGYGFLTP
mgnify:CR=1 FL=1